MEPKPMGFRPKARRFFCAVGTAFIVILLLFRFHNPSDPAFGHQRRASTSGLKGDIRNSTLGVSLTFVSLHLAAPFSPAFHLIVLFAERRKACVMLT